jgi:integrase
VDKRDGFKKVTEARKLIADVKFDVCPDTSKQYEDAFRRMTERKQRPDRIAQTRPTFYFYRAAFTYKLGRIVRDVLSRADHAAKNGNDNAWAQEVSKLDKLIAELNRFPPDPNKKMLGSATRNANDPKATTAKVFQKCNKSKRRSITKLPPDWQSRIFEMASPAYRLIISVLALTGARPCEIAMGIDIEVAGEQLRATLRGGKTHGGKYGQKIRQLTIDTGTPIGQFLRSAAANAGGSLKVRKNANAVSQQLSRLGKAAFPRAKPSVSAYSFRHQVSADLKRSGLSGLAVSAALGHCVDQTKRYYGSAHSAKGKSPIKGVTASREVRQKVFESLEVRLSNRNSDPDHSPIF